MPRTVGTMLKARLKLLFECDITLLGYHLPLDAHTEVGNNALWLKQLEFPVEDDKLGLTRGQAIGAIGTATKRQTLHDLVEQVNALANAKAQVYDYGSQSEPTEAIAREEGINFIAVGHYNSEKIGVQALSNLLQAQFGVETFFCDVPNQV